MFPPPPNHGRSNWWLETVGAVALIGLAAFYLTISWCKWCDALIDFGDQLYTAWRLSEGAVLYRDVDLLYGPLSQHINALLFRIFGPGIIVLVIANLVVVFAIVATLYLFIRKVWGAFAAFMACAVFISIFAFSQFVHFGNLNYVTPYSHEATHGLLVSLALCYVLGRWIENSKPLVTFVAGGLFGLTALLKPEFVVAGILMTVVAGLIRWRQGNFFVGRIAIVWAIGAIGPTICFALYFAWSMPWSAAFSSAAHGWTNALAPTHLVDAVQRESLGFDFPLRHAVEHITATVLACLIITALGFAAAGVDKIRANFFWLLATAGAASVFAAVSVAIRWQKVGRCLLGLTIIYMIVRLWSIEGAKREQDILRRGFPRLIFATLAFGLMMRMILNGRIYHYGFYQAALAGVLATVVVVREIPDWLRLSPRGRNAFLGMFLALLMPGIMSLTKLSWDHFRRKTTLVGSGRDHFYSYDIAIDPTGHLVNEISDFLRDREGSTVLVVPEGEMINYLARRPNPIAEFFFFAGVTSDGRELAIVEKLRSHPPDWIVIVSRDLGEYGIDRYGEKPGSGQEILNWIDRNYKRVAQLGGDPLDYREHGAWLLRRY